MDSIGTTANTDFVAGFDSGVTTVDTSSATVTSTFENVASTFDSVDTTGASTTLDLTTDGAGVSSDIVSSVTVSDIGVDNTGVDSTFTGDTSATSTDTTGATNVVDTSLNSTDTTTGSTLTGSGDTTGSTVIGDSGGLDSVADIIQNLDSGDTTLDTTLDTTGDTTTDTTGDTTVGGLSTINTELTGGSDIDTGTDVVGGLTAVTGDQGADTTDTVVTDAGGNTVVVKADDVIADTGADRVVSGTDSTDTVGGNNNITGNTSGTGHIGLGAVARSDGAFSNYWNGDLQDVLIWPRMLTAAEMIQVQMWACDKYTQAYPWAAYSNLMVFSGDSLTAGAVASNVVTASSYPYKLMQDAGRPYGAWTNIGVRSFTIDELTARDTAWTDPIPSLIGKPTTLCCWEWFNQKSDGHPGVYNKALTYIAARKAVANQRIVWGTSTCYNVADASRVSYNSAMDVAALVANNLAHGYVPIHSNSFIGVEGAYAANPTYYSDSIHMSDIGYTAMKALFDAELVARGLYA